MRNAIILINKLSDNPTDDEKDVLHQADQVEFALNFYGYSTIRLFMGLNLEESRDIILKINPHLVFNLVEGLNGKANLIHLAPALLESMHVPFTGCKLDSMFITSNKILTKKILNFNKIKTPGFFSGTELFEPDPLKTYIAKPLWEDASVGITDNSIFMGNNLKVLKDSRERWKDAFFIEEYIEGREFNVSILGGESGPEVMPLAEILFNDFPEGKPKIVGYAAKWDKETFEYLNTIRTFEYNNSDNILRNKISEMALQCWNIFALSGYARVDFRVDKNNIPHILEINSNPCLDKEAGFYAACAKAGLSYNEVINRIVYDAYQ